MLTKLSQSWDWSTLYPGGSESPQTADFLAHLQDDVTKLCTAIEELVPLQTAGEDSHFLSVIELLQSTMCRADDGANLCHCLVAENVHDPKAKQLQAAFSRINSELTSVLVAFETKVAQIPDNVWAELLTREPYLPLAYFLHKKRKQAQDRLAPEQETLAGDLMADGYHAWSKLHRTLLGSLRIPIEKDGESTEMSLAQVHGQFTDPDRAVRKHALERMEAALAEQAELCAHALNHLAGFRLQLYKSRGWESVLQEPLAMEGMSEQTLTAMWNAVKRNLHRAQPFTERKAGLLGIDSLEMCDQFIMISKSVQQITYDEAAQFIALQFAQFSPQLADFAKQAFENRWLDVEPRPGKTLGGFCARFPHSKQSRIFQTFHGGYSDVATTAHELGHAYHNYASRDLPYFAQVRGKSTAETASTFAELIVSDAALRNAKSKEERVAMLEAKAKNVVLYLMFVYALYLFEIQFYEERKQGLVSVERLNELMKQALQTTYGADSVPYTPYFWAMHQHLFNTETPFYNFSYTFGYLFSAGVYARALQEGPAFAEKYVALLQDSARMTVEDLAKKHLDVDLTQPDFWQSAIDLVMVDVEEFIRATDE